MSFFFNFFSQGSLGDTEGLLQFYRALGLTAFEGLRMSGLGVQRIPGFVHLTDCTCCIGGKAKLE